MKKVLLLAAVATLSGCAGHFSSQLTPGYQAVPADRIAVWYLEHADANVSTKASEVLVKQFVRCEKPNVLGPATVDSLLQANKILVPRRITEDFIKSLKPTLDAKYFVTGGVSLWRQGAVGFPVASHTEVSASLTMYDLETGKTVWTVSGQEVGGGGIFAEKPEEKAAVVFRKMLQEWRAMCKPGP